MSERHYWSWDELTPHEAIDLEDAAGAVVPAIQASIAAGLPTTRMLAAITWVARRRHDPEATFEGVLADAPTYDALAATAVSTVTPKPDDAETD